MSEVAKYLPENHPDLKDLLLDEARKNYPIGTKFHVGHLFNDGDNDKMAVVEEGEIPEWENSEKRTILLKKNGVAVSNTANWLKYLYYNNEWATIFPNKEVTDTVNNNSMIVGEFYRAANGKGNIFRWGGSDSDYYLGSNTSDYNTSFNKGGGCFLYKGNSIATPEEKQWLQACIEANKYMTKNEALAKKDSIISENQSSTKYKHEVVHCKTQKEWNFVRSKIENTFYYVEDKPKSKLNIDFEILNIKLPKSASVTLKNAENEVKINVKRSQSVKI